MPYSSDGKKFLFKVEKVTVDMHPEKDVSLAFV